MRGFERGITWSLLACILRGNDDGYMYDLNVEEQDRGA
jgi:hypothetical protein